jgi:hypothetical protein
MTLAELDAVIVELRNESIAAAICGDSIGALDAHNEAARLEAQRNAARHMEIVVSEK